MRDVVPCRHEWRLVGGLTELRIDLDGLRLEFLFELLPRDEVAEAVSVFIGCDGVPLRIHRVACLDLLREGFRRLPGWCMCVRVGVGGTGAG